jgi:hypothetical protein
MFERGEWLTAILVVLNLSLLLGGIFIAFVLWSGAPADLIGLSFCP